MANRNQDFGIFGETAYLEHDGIYLPDQSTSTTGTNSFYQQHGDHSTSDHRLPPLSTEASDNLYQFAQYGMEPSANQPWSVLGQLYRSQSFHDNQMPVFDPQSGFYDISALGVPAAQWEDPAPQYDHEGRAELPNGTVNPEAFDLDHQNSTFTFQHNFGTGMAGAGTQTTSHHLIQPAASPQAQPSVSGLLDDGSMDLPGLSLSSLRHERYHGPPEVETSEQQQISSARPSRYSTHGSSMPQMHGHDSLPRPQAIMQWARSDVHAAPASSVTQHNTSAAVSPARLRQDSSRPVRQPSRHRQRHDSVFSQTWQQHAVFSDNDTTSHDKGTAKSPSVDMKRKASDFPSVQRHHKRSKLVSVSSVDEAEDQSTAELESYLTANMAAQFDTNVQGVTGLVEQNTPKQQQRTDGVVVGDVVGSNATNATETMDPHTDTQIDSRRGKSLKTVVQEEFHINADEVEAMVDVITNGGSITDDDEFPTAEKALAHLDGTGPGTTWHKPHIDDDDFELLDEAKIKQELQRRLMSALTEDFLTEWRNCSTFHKAHIKKKHEERFAWVKNQIAENPADTRARIALVIAAVIHLHRDGIPSSRLDLRRHKEADIEADNLSKYPVKTAAGRIADMTTPCIARILNIVKAAKHNKSFAYDLLKGYRVEDYYEVVIATQSCFSQKLSNAMSNAERAFQAEKVARNKGKEPEKKNTKSSITKPANKSGRKSAKAGQVSYDSDEEGLDE